MGMFGIISVMILLTGNALGEEELSRYQSEKSFFKPRFDWSGVSGNQANEPPPEQPTLVQERSTTRVLHYSDVSVNSRQTCQCNWKGEWGDWSACTARMGKCYMATQMRIRRCQRDCVRIQVRSCLDKSSCTGSWSEWINQTCTNQVKKSIRFCKSNTGEIGPFCASSNGRASQEKQIPCEQNANKIPPPGLQRTSSGRSDVREEKHWTLSNKTNFIVIILAVLAGLLLVALIFVSAMLAKGKRQKTGRNRSITRDFRSVSESNMSATSYLSGMERESRASGRVSIYQQNIKGSQRKRSLMLPINYTFVSTTEAANNSIIVKAPLQHNDSLMLTRKQISKRESRGSVRSINKLIKEQQRSLRYDHVTLSADESDGSRSFLVGSSENIALELTGKEKRNTLQRRATDGSYDTHERRKNKRYMSDCSQRNASISHEQEKSKINAGNDKEPKEPAKTHDSDSDTNSMDSGFHRLTKKRLSVDDICRIFESKSVEQSPVKNASKPANGIPHNTGVGENINLFEQETNKKQNDDKPENIIETIKKKISSSNMGTQSLKQNVSPPHATDETKKSSTLSYDLSTDNNGTEDIITVNERTQSASSDHNLETNTQGKNDSVVYNSGIKQEKRTFLFSSQAYSSLQRSHDNRYETVHPTQNGFKMNIDALMKKTDKKNQQELNKPTKDFKDHTYSNGNFRRNSFHDITGNKILIPPRLGQSSYDSDTYADVWDAKVKEDNGKSTDSIYADVWDSDNTVLRQSYCEDDDGDYSEVYDSVDLPNSSSKPRRFAVKSRSKPSKNAASKLATTVSKNEESGPKLWPTGQRLRTKTYSPPKEETRVNGAEKGSMSCGSSPVRPPLPIHRPGRLLSRESSTGSDGSAPQDKFGRSHNKFHVSHSYSALADLDKPSEPIYCAI
ncbi:uncharacterized protein LOC120327926 [Styela clava]